MNLNTLQEIEQAIGDLTPQEFEELRTWLDQYNQSQPIDRKLETDLKAGLLDQRIERAVDDYENGRTRPL